MPITEDRVARLREFGLSEYAARAYLALLDLGLTEARDVSTLSRVPTSKIYHILEQLHEKGLVTILPEFPKKYAPVPFDEYLDKLQEEHEEAANRIERDREELAALFSVIGSVEAGDRGGFTVIRGRRNVLAKIAECNAGTEREMFVLGSHGFSQRIGHSWDDIQRAAKRGVRMRYLVPLSGEAMPALSALAKLADVRAREFDESMASGNVAIGIHDNQRAIVVHFVPDDGHLYQGNDTAIYTDHEGMVSVIRALVEPHWSRASPYAARQAMIASGRAPEFTRFYGTTGEATDAFREALRRGARELRSVSALPAAAPTGPIETIADEIGAAGVRLLAVMNVADAAVGEALLAGASARPWAEVRHLEPSTLSRFWVLDEREAFFSLVRPRPGATLEESEDLIIHTNNPATVRSLRARFDELWPQARAIAMRCRELELAVAPPSETTRFLTVAEESITASQEVVAAARREMRVFSAHEGLRRFVESTVARAASARGVRIRVLAPVTHDTRALAERASAIAEVRHAPSLGILGNSSDGADLFLILPRAGGPGLMDDGRALPWSMKYDLILRSSDPVYLRIYDGLFESMWESATPLGERLADLDQLPFGRDVVRVLPGAGEAEAAAGRPRPGGNPI